MCHVIRYKNEEAEKGKRLVRMFVNSKKLEKNWTPLRTHWDYER